MAGRRGAALVCWALAATLLLPSFLRARPLLFGTPAASLRPAAAGGSCQRQGAGTRRRLGAGVALRRHTLEVCRRAAAGAETEVAGPKAELLRACEEFKAKQEETWEMMDQEEEAAKAADKKNKKSGGKKASLLEAESFASQQTQLNDELAGLRNRTIDAIHRLAALNPTPEPLSGWRGFGGASPASCVLNGTWKLLFTDAADATFRKGKRGKATTFQEIDAEGGWFVNCVDFESPDSKLKGFRVFVEGEALSPTEVQLSFRKVRLLRRSRFPKLFGQITIPLPNPKLLRNLGKIFARARDKEAGVNPSRRGAGFQLLYVDGDLRVHRTFDGLFFVQRRLS